METCMSSAVYSKMRCKVYSPLSENWVFIHDAVTPIFMGWKAVKYGVNITNECLRDDVPEEKDDDLNGSVKGDYEYLSLLKWFIKITNGIFLKKKLEK